MGVRNFLRKNGDIVALASGITGLMLPLTGISAYESRRYADLYSLYQHPALMERSEIYTTITPILGLIYLGLMGSLVYSAIARREDNNSL